MRAAAAASEINVLRHSATSVQLDRQRTANACRAAQTCTMWTAPPPRARRARCSTSSSSTRSTFASGQVRPRGSSPLLRTSLHKQSKARQCNRRGRHALASATCGASWARRGRPRVRAPGQRRQGGAPVGRKGARRRAAGTVHGRAGAGAAGVAAARATAGGAGTAAQRGEGRRRFWWGCGWLVCRDCWHGRKPCRTGCSC